MNTCKCGTRIEDAQTYCDNCLCEDCGELLKPDEEGTCEKCNDLYWMQHRDYYGYKE